MQGRKDEQRHQELLKEKKELEKNRPHGILMKCEDGSTIWVKFYKNWNYTTSRSFRTTF